MERLREVVAVGGEAAKRIGCRRAGSLDQALNYVEKCVDDSVAYVALPPIFFAR